MKLREIKILIVPLLLIGLVGCDFPNLPTSVATNSPSQYGTVAALLTQTAIPATPSPRSTHTSEVTAINSTQPVLTNTRTGTLPVQPIVVSSTPICDIARAGVPIDVSIPDDTQMRPGETFVKTWRLLNAGKCTWTRRYSLAWFSGDDMGVRRIEPFGVSVAPGDVVDFSVDMIAPMTPGTYQSNWKLRNEAGDVFGIGPGGGAPFWVRIKVVAIDTPTVTRVVPTPTSTPPVSISGQISLQIDNSVDFDAGQVTSNTDADLRFVKNLDNFELQPLSGARISLHGSAEPTLNDCQRASLSDAAIGVTDDISGNYLCISTNKGLPGKILITRVSTGEQALDVSFLIWSIP